MITDYENLTTKEEYGKLAEYYDYITKFPGLRIDSLHLGYHKDNFQISKMIPTDKIVIDVGCGFGFQHLLYKNHKKWIGIQYFLPFNATEGIPELKVFTKNAKIIIGKFKDVYGELGITEENKDDFFGIAHHSLWHSPGTNAEDISIFKSLFPNNYYVTNEASEIIEYNMFKKKTKSEIKPKVETPEKEVDGACDHTWFKNEGNGKRYVCPKCGEQSD